MSKQKAFTLIELLVVVAIIALLVSILIPSLEEARYAGQLAVCASNLHHWGIALYLYANDNNERWPVRWDSEPGVGSTIPSILAQLRADGTGSDLREVLKPYLNIDVCPLAEKTNLMAEFPGGVTEIYGSYDLWAGWQLIPGEEPMLGVHDKFTFGNDSFNVLASDLAYFWTSGQSFTSVHPDSPRSLLGPFTNEGLHASGNYPNLYQVYSHYEGQDADLGRQDLNFLYHDGGVDTIRDIIPHNDPRLVEVATHFGWQLVQLPTAHSR